MTQQSELAPALLKLAEGLLLSSPEYVERIKRHYALFRGEEQKMNEKTTVLLYELSGLALIVPASTGIVYQNQTGGHACLPSRQEGYLLPFAGDVANKCERLLTHFTGPKWGGWCSERIDAETADFVDSILAEMPGRDQIVVDRAKLDASWEAWVHVKIVAPLLALVENGNPREAILTWPNSD